MRTPARVAIAVACAAAAIAACGGGADGAQSGVRLVRIGTFDSPTYVAAAPGDGKRLFVVEQAGQIRVLKGRHKLSRPFLDISGLVGFGGEQGLLSMAFASNYRSTGRFYVYFTARNGDIRVMQFRRFSSADRADPNSGHQVIRIAHSEFPNHNGGQVQIGPDHMLYLAPGDGGSEGDPFGRGQSLGTLLGKVLRIDPRPGGGYTIPSGNPFAHRSGARGEIWAYGLRNPYRFSFDRKTGDMAVADVGQDTWEEVDFARRGRAGANYGWSIFEGFSRFKPGNAPHYVPPVFVTSHPIDLSPLARRNDEPQRQIPAADLAEARGGPGENLVRVAAAAATGEDGDRDERSEPLHGPVVVVTPVVVGDVVVVS